MARTRQPGLLLGEWACLGALVHARGHGFAVSKRLAPDGDLGRVWSISRPLVYRSIHILLAQGMIRTAGEQAGGGPNRTLLAPTPKGRTALHRWLDEPVDHLRDLRAELLLKLVIHDLVGSDPTSLLDAQILTFERLHERVRGQSELPALDPVAAWRLENSAASVRFVHWLRDDWLPNSASGAVNP